MVRWSSRSRRRHHCTPAYMLGPPLSNTCPMEWQYLAALAVPNLVGTESQKKTVAKNCIYTVLEGTVRCCGSVIAKSTWCYSFGCPSENPSIDVNAQNRTTADYQLQLCSLSSECHNTSSICHCIVCWHLQWPARMPTSQALLPETFFPWQTCK